jgi:hypothetical protein
MAAPEPAQVSQHVAEVFWPADVDHGGRVGAAREGEVSGNRPFELEGTVERPALAGMLGRISRQILDL